MVEVVNCHVELQEDIMEQEYRELNIPWKPFPNNEKQRRLKEYDEADYILLPSEFVKRSFIAKGFAEEKLLKVPYGFNKPASSGNKKSPTTNQDFTVLYVGTISIRKGIKYLIEAFHKLQHPNKKLVLVGPDIADGAIKGMELTADIIFTGSLKGAELEAAYAAADVFCLPSIEDGFGLVLGEAMSHGLPIVTTTNTAAEDIIIDGVEGYIVPIRDSEAIFNKLQALADDPQLLETMHANSFAKAEKLNGWEETGKNLVDTLNKVYQNK